jgi:hypothetical protein
MAQKDLNVPQVRAPLQQVLGKTVAQDVSADVLPDPGALRLMMAFTLAGL